MILKNVRISFFDLEDSDKVEGYTLKDLIAFAKMAQKAKISEADLKQFMKDTNRVMEVLREEIADAAMTAIERFELHDQE